MIALVRNIAYFHTRGRTAKAVSAKLTTHESFVNRPSQLKAVLQHMTHAEVHSSGDIYLVPR